MKKVKKFLLSILCIVLVAVLSVAGTLAFLQDQDEDVNVMTMGNVKIDQLEFERVVNDNGEYEMITSEKYGEGYKIKDFTQDKPLYPAVGKVSGWGQSVYFDQLGAGASGGQAVLDGIQNVQDKIVLVKNTGRSDAYVRTWIAFEMGDITTAEEWNNLIMTSTGDFWTLNWKGAAEIDGNNYYIAEFIYKGSETRHQNGVLPAGEYTYNSLAQVYMKSNATNEDVEKLDGNNNDRYDILVFSQAVQTKGFENAETALNEAFGTEHPWVEETFTVTNWTEMTEAVSKRAIINLGANLPDEDKIVETSGKSLTINGNGNSIVAGTIQPDNTKGHYGFIINGGIATINDLEIETIGGGIGASNGAKIVFNGNSLYVNSANTSGRYNFYAVGEGTEVTINSGTFTFSSTKNQKRAYIYAGAGAKVIVNGGTFGKASARDGYTAGILGDGTVIITGGTFGFDPSNWVADGYEAVVDGTNWIVKDK